MGRSDITGPDREGEIGVVIVLFNPPATIVNHIRNLRRQFPHIVVVSNAAGRSTLAEIRTISNVDIIENVQNVGIAAALNQGIFRNLENRAVGYVLLLDQDSLPPDNLGEALKRSYIKAEISNLEPACIGPRLVDIKNSEIYQYPERSSDGLIVTDVMATSGCLLSRGAFETVGGMMECLFIDQVDHEWCFRARSKGMNIIVSWDAIMSHDLGTGKISYFGRPKSIHKSPVRHYFIVRNTLFLLSKKYIPFKWKTAELTKTVRRVAAYAVFSEERMLTIRAIWQAFVDALTGDMGGAIPDFIKAHYRHPTKSTGVKSDR